MTKTAFRALTACTFGSFLIFMVVSSGQVPPDQRKVIQVLSGPRIGLDFIPVIPILVLSVLSLLVGYIGCLLFKRWARYLLLCSTVVFLLMPLAESSNELHGLSLLWNNVFFALNGAVLCGCFFCGELVPYFNQSKK